MTLRGSIRSLAFSSRARNVLAKLLLLLLMPLSIGSPRLSRKLFSTVITTCACKEQHIAECRSVVLS
jgi:hypothetical protein